MRQYVIGVAMIAATAAIVYAGSARAEVPPKGFYGIVDSGASVICIKDEDVKALVKIGTDTKGTGIDAKFHELFAQTDDKGRHECAITRLGPVAVGESYDLGDSYAHEGSEIHAWSVHVGDANAEGWYLYYEVKPKAVDASTFQFDQWTWTRTMQSI